MRPAPFELRDEEPELREEPPLDERLRAAERLPEELFLRAVG